MSYNEDVREQSRNKKKSPYVNGKGASSPRFTFISLSPTKEEKVQIKEWSAEFTLVIDALNDIINNRCKVSIGYSEKNDAFTCSCTDLHSTSPNYGVVVTSYAGLPERALFTTLWFIVEKWGDLQEWPKARLTEDDW